MLRSALLKRTQFLPRLASRKAFVPVMQRRKYSDDVFLTTNSANYIDEMYAAWKEDPKSVHVSWQVSTSVEDIRADGTRQIAGSTYFRRPFWSNHGVQVAFEAMERP